MINKVKVTLEPVKLEAVAKFVKENYGIKELSEWTEAEKLNEKLSDLEEISINLEDFSVMLTVVTVYDVENTMKRPPFKTVVRKNRLRIILRLFVF